MKVADSVVLDLMMDMWAICKSSTMSETYEDYEHWAKERIKSKNDIMSKGKPDHYQRGFECAEPDLCTDCRWFNKKKQCSKNPDELEVDDSSSPEDCEVCPSCGKLFDGWVCRCGYDRVEEMSEYKSLEDE